MSFATLLDTKSVQVVGGSPPLMEKMELVCLLFVSSQKPSLDTFATRKCLLLSCATCNWIKQPYEMEWQVLPHFLVCSFLFDLPVAIKR